MKRSLAFCLAVCLLLGCCMTGVGAADKVYALTMGVHKQDGNSTVSDGSSVGVVTYTRLKDGSHGSANKIFDVEYGEEFDLATRVADGQESCYMFLGWFNGDGELLSREHTLHVVVEGSTAVFATYVEIENRCLVTYICRGEGKLSFSSDKDFQNGDGCASVLRGANATIGFSPASGYTVRALRVDGWSVSMTENLVRDLSRAVQKGKIKDVFKALLNYVKFLIGKEAKYTIENVTADTTFEVIFAKKHSF